MKERPRLSIGAAVIIFPFRLTIAKLRQMIASKMIQMIAWPKVTHYLAQQRKINLMSCRKKIMQFS